MIEKFVFFFGLLCFTTGVWSIGTKMRWVEIIEIRSFGNEKALMEPDLPALLEELAREKEAESIEIYCHGELKSDWSIHIHHSTEAKKVSRSLVGLRLASILKEFGFVHHSIWNEMRRCEPIKGK